MDLESGRRFFLDPELTLAERCAGQSLPTPEMTPWGKIHSTDSRHMIVGESSST